MLPYLANIAAKVSNIHGSVTAHAVISAKADGGLLLISPAKKLNRMEPNRQFFLNNRSKSIVH